MNEESRDIFQYDNIPKKLKVQLIHIFRETLGDESLIRDEYRAYHHEAVRAYGFIVNTLRRELGVFFLPPRQRESHMRNLAEELYAYILEVEQVDYFLSAVEITCRIIEHVSSRPDYMGRHKADQMAKDAISEINERFKENGFGYEYNREIFRIDSEFVHAEAVKPALFLLGKSQFSGAEQEFRSGFDHYKNKKYKETLNDALKSLESTFKSIFDIRDWPYSQKDSAAKLIDVAISKGLIPEFWRNHFSGLRATLEAGVPTARNRLGGHGQGSSHVPVPEHIAAYVLHMTASTIVFLIRAHENEP